MIFYKSIDLGKKINNGFPFFLWTKYEKDNNGQNGVLLYGTKDYMG